MNIVISNFTQGGFYIDTNEDYDSDSEIRSGWIDLPYQPFKITVQTINQWIFVCADSNGNFIQISESSGYKNGGYIVDLRNYSWIKKIRIELHNSNGISPPESCTFQELSPWFMSDDDLPATSEFIDVPEKYMEAPYPNALWRIEPTTNNGCPFNKLLPLENPSGAFMNAVNLEYVYIPRSCKKIGAFAFSNTKLRRVMIAADCEYYPTTFPKGCQIDFYNNQGGTQ